MEKVNLKKVLLNNKEVIEKLDLYLPTVKKVHGNNHEEIYEIDKIYNNIKEDFKNLDYMKLKSRFNKLRNLTDNYQVPRDACEAYKSVYNMLEKLDKDLMV